MLLAARFQDAWGGPQTASDMNSERGVPGQLQELHNS